MVSKASAEEFLSLYTEPEKNASAIREWIGANVVVFSPIGGSATRLYPTTWNKPKPLVTVANVPLIDIAIDSLARQGITEFHLALIGHPNVYGLRQHLGVGEEYYKKHDLPKPIEFMFQDPTRKTCGSADCFRVTLQDYDIANKIVVCIQGDTLIDLNVADVVAHHLKANVPATIVLKPVQEEERSKFGLIELDEAGRITKFVEKDPAATKSNLANTGVNIFDGKAALDALTSAAFMAYTSQGKGDFGKDFFPAIARGEISDFGMSGYVYQGTWHDIGTHEGRLQAQMDAFAGKVKSAVIPGKVTPDEITRLVESPEARAFAARLETGELKLWIDARTAKEKEARTKILQDAIAGKIKLNGGVALEKSCTISEGATMENSSIGVRANLGRDTAISNCIIRDYCVIGDGASLDSSIVGATTAIESSKYKQTRISKITVLGRDVFVPAGTILESCRAMHAMQIPFGAYKRAEFGYLPRQMTVNIKGCGHRAKEDERMQNTLASLYKKMALEAIRNAKAAAKAVALEEIPDCLAHAVVNANNCAAIDKAQVPFREKIAQQAMALRMKYMPDTLGEKDKKKQVKRRKPGQQAGEAKKDGAPPNTNKVG